MTELHFIDKDIKQQQGLASSVEDWLDTKSTLITSTSVSCCWAEFES